MNKLKFAPSDLEILNNLFTTMCDGEDWAYYKDYIVAISLFVQGSAHEKILFTFQAHNAIIDGKKLVRSWGNGSVSNPLWQSQCGNFLLTHYGSPPNDRMPVPSSACALAL
jgi:hypothetical protein